jgi:hypothetical protein
VNRVGGALGSYGDRCAGCGRECLHRVLAVHLLPSPDPDAPVASRVVPSCGPGCDAAAIARAARPRPGATVTAVPWRRDGGDWRPDQEGADDPTGPADPFERVHLAARSRWFHPVRCGHRPAHVARVLQGTAEGVAWTRWSCPVEPAVATPAADSRLSEVVERQVAAWDPTVLRYDRGAARRAAHGVPGRA